MSGATRYLTAIELRRHRRGLLVLSALTALVTAVVLATLAGAGRTGSAFDRYLTELRSPEAAAFGDPEVLAQLDDLDAVAEAIDFELVAAFPTNSGPDDFYPLVVSEGGALPFERFRLPVVDGRQPSRSAPFEVALGERTSRRLGVGVGDRLELVTFTREAVQQDEFADPDGPAVQLDVVGIVRDPGDLGGRADDVTLTFLTPAFRAAHPSSEIGTVSDGAMVALAEGHALSEVTQAMGTAVEIDPTFSGESFREQLDPTVRSLATALRVFAAVAALAGLVAIVLSAARLQQAAADDDRALGALGADRAARWARLALPVGLATASGVALGAALSVAASPLFPIGLARRAEPDLGLSFDAGVALGGALLGMLVLVAATTLTAVVQRRRGSTAARAPRTNVVGRAAASAGAPVEVVTGLTLAGGPTSGTSGIAAGGALLGVLGVLAVVAFGASIERLRDDPELYGWAWDAVIEGADLSDLGGDPDVADLVVEDERVVASGRYYSQAAATVDGVPEYVTAMSSVKGTVAGPVMVRGRAPTAANEIALGQDTLERLGAEIGDEVALEMTTGAARVMVTGTTAFPVSGDGGSLATGVFLSSAAMDPLDIDGACSEEQTSCTRKIVVELAPRSDPIAFASDIEGADETVDVTLPTPPPDIDRLTAVEDLPGYLALFLALLGATAVGFATGTTVRQRRRDLAMLRVLGMTTRHVRAVVAVLVAAMTTVGVLTGAVLGVAAGRQVWRWIADAVAVPFAPELPLSALFLVPLAALLLAQVVATASRRSAGRVPAALVLRTE